MAERLVFKDHVIRVSGTRTQNVTTMRASGADVTVGGADENTITVSTSGREGR